MKLLLVDDHEIIREGLKKILLKSNIKNIDEAGNGRDALDKIREENYDLILLDISLPDISGLDVLKEIKKHDEDIPVLILSTHPEKRYAIRVIKAGANGYLNKSCSPSELLKAINKASQGGKYITSSIAENLALLFEKDAEGPLHETLSDREYEVFIKLAIGKSVSEIAEELFLSVKTISTYRSRIMEKMNMSNNAEITYYAIKNNLVD